MITKKKISISIDRKLYDEIEKCFICKSKYIQNLIYQDLLIKCDENKFIISV